ncbi:MAG: DUF3108 domain-containing protein [Gemmatimonadetes bacterium]|nr:DUF3108 domain-containing protein [Gemmatimonadota bacterium]
MLAHSAAFAAFLVSLFAFAAPASAQTVTDHLRTAEAPPAPVPFGVGEKLVYTVSLSPFGEVGDGSFEVVELDTIHGHTTYRLQMRVKGGVLFAKVNDHYESWLDVHSLISRRFKQDQKEVKYERHRTLDFFPEQLRWRRLDKDESGPLPTDRPLDDISFIYYARTLPLEVGRTYTLPQYFHKDGNPVVLKVLRRDTVTVPAGRFATIVVQPIIQTKGLFGKGGKAEVFFSDDDRRLLVQMKSDVPVLGSLNLKLKSVDLGERLSADPAARYP